LIGGDNGMQTFNIEYISKNELVTSGTSTRWIDYPVGDSVAYYKTTKKYSKVPCHEEALEFEIPEDNKD